MLGRRDFVRYDLELLRAISEAVTVPVVASGGAGDLEDMYQALIAGKSDAVLAASIYHYGIYTIRATKEYLEEKGKVQRETQGQEVVFSLKSKG